MDQAIAGLPEEIAVGHRQGDDPAAVQRPIQVRADSAGCTSFVWEAAELTDLVDLGDWPERTRLIVRCEPLHPGAQGSLFASTTYRHWGHYTDAAGRPVDLDVHMRAHAHVEDNIRPKDSGAQRFPFTDLDANRACPGTRVLPFRC